MLKEIQDKLITFSDSEDARFLQRFFKTGPGQYGEGDLFRGIRVPAVRKLSKEYRQIPLNLVEKLLHSEYHEDRLLALFILVLKYATVDEEMKTAIYSMYLSNSGFINNWDLVDASAEHIVGAYLRGRCRAPLYLLAHSRILWERRISILATFHFIKRGESDDTLKIAEILLADKEDLIHKGVGWMLREVGKRDLQSEVTFLDAYCRVMPRTMLRYAIEKFPRDERQRYMKR